MTMGSSLDRLGGSSLVLLGLGVLGLGGSSGMMMGLAGAVATC